jgi:hypothetical protein
LWWIKGFIILDLRIGNYDLRSEQANVFDEVNKQLYPTAKITSKSNVHD